MSHTNDMHTAKHFALEVDRNRVEFVPETFQMDSRFTKNIENVEKIQNISTTAPVIIEKKHFLTFDSALCAHGSKGQNGCNACLNVCPTEAISSEGDSVSIDARICDGCGLCSVVCPTDAIIYANPDPVYLRQRIQTLANSFFAKTDLSPSLLLHDQKSDSNALGLVMSRLPENVLPIQLDQLNSVGHATMLFALASGFQSVVILTHKTADVAVLNAQIDLAKALIAPLINSRLTLLQLNNPDELSLHYAKNNPLPNTDYQQLSPDNTSAKTGREAIKIIAPASTKIQNLPGNSPYGSVKIDSSKCTFCLACTNLCPSGALGENPDAPQLLFSEINCTQCGLCKNGCPEDAITLLPQFNPSAAEHGGEIAYQAQPYICIECGDPFGIKSTIDRIVKMLTDSSAKYDHSANVKLVCMCDSCKLKAQFPQN